jgi:sugar O-acyltransferase (sialic acid O-acetyltransferase NeuD family)
MSRYFIYGAGGHGKVVFDAMQVAKMHCDGFVDSKNISLWFGLPVLKEDEVNRSDFVHIAIGNASVREKIASSHPDYAFFSIIHPSSSVAKSAKISASGVFVAAQSVIGPEAEVLDHSIINHGAIIDHDCKVGRFCHVAPNAVLGGGVSIGNHVMVGAGAVILPGLTICDNVTIGAGAVVTKNILSPQVVIGVPAKKII